MADLKLPDPDAVVLGRPCSNWLARIIAKSDSGERSECWDWQACFRKGSSKTHGTPALASYDKTYMVPKIGWLILHPDVKGASGKKWRWYRGCGNWRCANPWHMACGRIGRQTSPYAKRGLMNHGALTLANMVAARRARSKDMTMERAQAIRQRFAESATRKELVAEFGVSYRIVCLIVSNNSWMPLAAGASIFSGSLTNVTNHR